MRITVKTADDELVALEAERVDIQKGHLIFMDYWSNVVAAFPPGWKWWTERENS